MQEYLKNLKNINSIEDAISSLRDIFPLNPKIVKAITFCIKAHEGQYRKSGEPYSVHPILVATITAYFSKDESMILAALLHDVVEDTNYNIEYIEDNYGKDVAHIVDGLTKITDIKHNEFENPDNKLIKSALTFRKMIIASTDDVRVLVVKLFDRTHNLLTLDALDSEKQIRIAEETLVVYAPIAHRLGMSSIKNILEDLSFYYVYPNEYNKIDIHIKSQQQKIQNVIDTFVSDIKTVINPDDQNEIEIFSRIKHYYSIYLKMQRKGINIEEVLDLFAIRIITKNTLDCYNILGKIHIHYKPLVARFKDYIAVPKENGYKTIHTTIFNNTKIFEIQIRTQNMHNIAEFGVAAHWKYKNSSTTTDLQPNLNWLHTLEVDNENIEEFYADTKQELFSEEVIVYSPNGAIFTLPRGSTAYDFAYLIHTDLGNTSVDCFINTLRKPLLTQLKSGDIISINRTNVIKTRCSWYDMVKTAKAKKNIKLLCQSKVRKIDELNGKNIINTIFSRYKSNVIGNLDIQKVEKIPYSLDHLKNIKKTVLNIVKNKDGILARLKLLNITLKEYRFDNIILNTNFNIATVSFDHCCHPKQGDDIISFKYKKDVIVHHKMCDHAFAMMEDKNQMVFCKWNADKYFSYKMVLSILPNKGELARLLIHLSNNEAIILNIDFSRDQTSHIQYCTLDMEIKNPNLEDVKKIVSKKAKVIECYASVDAYK